MVRVATLHCLKARQTTIPGRIRRGRVSFFKQLEEVKISLVG